MDRNMNSGTISALHPDILHTQILARLDAPTLAAAGCASSHLRALTANHTLWRDICHRAWPSTAHPRARHLISTFPAGHRSFYSDSFSSLHRHRRQTTTLRPRARWTPTSLISAVDVHYKNNLLLSKTQETEIESRFSVRSPFQVGLLDPKELVPISGELDFRDLNCESELGKNLTLSWILIDPAGKRAANLSSVNPVGVDRDWSTGDIEIRFVTVLSGEKKGELVQCGVVVTCGEGEEEDRLHVRQVRLEMEDVEGKKLGWKESLVILLEAMESGERRRRRGKEREEYEELLKMKEERRERKLRRERRREEVGMWTGVVIVMGFWVFVAVRFFHLFHSFFF